MEKNRNLYLDLLKSFLIITVVIGHTLVYFFPEKYIYNNIFKVIYSFHMFLFIFISGYLVSFSKQNINLDWIKKRFIRLMLPYIVWTALIMILNNKFDFLGFLLELIKPSYWFLIILFLYDLTYYIIKNFIRKIKNQIKFIIIYIVTVILIWIITKRYISQTDILHMYSIYLPEYFLGVFLYSYREKVIKIIKKYKKIFLLLYPIAMTLYTYEDHSKFNNIIQYNVLYYLDYTLSTNILNIISTVYNHYIVAPLGMVFWTLIIYYIYKSKINIKIFSYIGKYTLSIYVISNLFNYRYINIENIDILISIFLGILLPIIIEYVSKFFPKIHYILFGTYK